LLAPPPGVILAAMGGRRSAAVAVAWPATLLPWALARAEPIEASMVIADVCERGAVVDGGCPTTKSIAEPDRTSALAPSPSVDATQKEPVSGAPASPSPYPYDHAQWFVGGGVGTGMPYDLERHALRAAFPSAALLAGHGWRLPAHLYIRGDFVVGLFASHLYGDDLTVGSTLARVAVGYQFLPALSLRAGPVAGLRFVTVSDPSCRDLHRGDFAGGGTTALAFHIPIGELAVTADAYVAPQGGSCNVFSNEFGVAPRGPVTVERYWTQPDTEIFEMQVTLQGTYFF
jgi:hypothetical protein